MKKIILKLLLVLIPVGCSDYEITKIPEYSPEIEVSPGEKDYGSLFSGKEKKQETILVTNVGNEELILHDVTLDKNSQNFKILSEIPDELDPGGNFTILIEYDPKTFEKNSESLKIFSNDDDESLVVVDLTGKGDAPIISIDPDYYNFDTVYLGCEDSVPVNISNIGNVDLTIEDLAFFSSHPVNFNFQGFYDDYGPLPIVIPPSTYITLEVDYLPDDMLDDAAYIEIASDDPVNPIVHADQDGMGDYENEITDVFNQDETVDVDILFVVDNSGSMSSNQTNLKNNFEAFMNAFVSAGVSYQIAIITTDDSNFVGPVINSVTPDPLIEFNNQVDSIGTRGSAQEKGLWFAHESTTTGDASSPEFMRSDARLVIVYVSDEPDRSSNIYGGGGSSTMTHTDYTASLLALKSSTSLIVAHAIAGDYPGGCTANGSAEFGEGYYEVVRDLGGTFMSICSEDWSITMDTLARDSIMMSGFPLTEKAIEATIQVKVNGTTSSSWRYEEDSNTIVFDIVPVEGSDIEISYGVLSCQ